MPMSSPFFCCLDFGCFAAAVSLGLQFSLLLADSIVGIEQAILPGQLSYAHIRHLKLTPQLSPVRLLPDGELKEKTGGTLTAILHERQGDITGANHRGVGLDQVGRVGVDIDIFGDFLAAVAQNHGQAFGIALNAPEVGGKVMAQAMGIPNFIDHPRPHGTTPQKLIDAVGTQGLAG